MLSAIDIISGHAANVGNASNYPPWLCYCVVPSLPLACMHQLSVTSQSPQLAVLCFGPCSSHCRFMLKSELQVSELISPQWEAAGTALVHVHFTGCALELEFV